VRLVARSCPLRGCRSCGIGAWGGGLYGDVVASALTTLLGRRMHGVLAQRRDGGAQAVAM